MDTLPKFTNCSISLSSFFCSVFYLYTYEISHLFYYNPTQDYYCFAQIIPNLSIGSCFILASLILCHLSSFCLGIFPSFQILQDATDLSCFFSSSIFRISHFYKDLRSLYLRIKFKNPGLCSLLAGCHCF